MKYITTLVIILSLFGCDQTVKRRDYVEYVDSPHSTIALPTQQQSNDPSMQNMLMKSVSSSLNFSWVTPLGWIESAGTGMRLASFTSDQNNEILTTIVSLNGEVGDLDSNLIRWARQIGIDATEEKNLSLLKSNISEIKLNQKLTFSLLTLHSDDTPENNESMMIAWGKIKDSSVFIKMTGIKSAIEANNDKFLALCNSIKFNNE